MEDAHIVVENFAGRPGQGLFAVFDGHGGRGIVDYLAKHFSSVLEEELKYDGGTRSIAECLTSAYLITDIQTSQEGLMTSGSTAASCLIRHEECGDEKKMKRVLYCANVGDTRAVLCRQDGKAQRLTFDHKASDPSEIKRIEDAGGFILRKRVLGILSVSRSFGDHAMKKFVVARPFTTTTILQDTDRFLIIACDGIWDVFTDEQAVSFVCQILDEEKISEKEVAKRLVDEAISRGSLDNVTVIVVYF
eukprot:CAMPEP_0184014972 /NCGR_PEP_ID=MMETSP0954-20121128/6023_1 /TAXON_ID=627963 /ORGANISM="Aplanochytrium sp, Strain PBS07" /LENGTH=247 /DNA_ID=CAMNT_0026295647 /DNA_START=242 /DNA_END=985 /DNA_ORIENTATION=-